MKLNKGILGCLFLVALFFSACQDKESTVKPKKDNLTKGDVFDFSTTRNVEIDIQYNVPKDFQVYFEAYTKNPVELDEIGDYIKKSSVRPFLEGYTDKNGACKMTLELPDATEEIYVYSETIGVPALLYGKVENGKVVITDESEAVSSKALSTRAAVYWKNWKKQTIDYITLPNGNWSPNGRPHNLLSPGLELDAEALEIINATIPKGEKLNPQFCTFNEIALSESSNVKLYYVSNNHKQNAIAYYTFTGEQPSQEWINKNLILIYPRLHRGALKAGEGIELKYYENGEWKDRFPAGTKIGFVLLVDAWHAQQLETNTHVMYSYKGYNSYNIGNSIMADRPQMAVFKARDRFVISFEDYPWTQAPNSPYQGDFSDNVFILEADPETALPPVEEGKEPGEPDGVLCAFARGMVAFEDLWPYKGDYDMNDIVLKYNSGMYLEDYTDITAIRDTFVLKNNGAGNILGFGYELNTAVSNIKSVKVISDYTCEGQGLDEGADKATIMLFDNVHNLGKGTTSFIVEVDFKESVSFANFKIAPYNPFIVVCSKDENGNYPDYMANNRREVHLVNYAPTYKMNELLLHTGDDLSNPKNGVYYVSDAQYPFALNIPYEYWKIPGEKQNISEAYPKFNSWVSSNGTKDKDWWENPAH